MRYRILFLALALLAVSALASAATLPVSPAPAAPAAVAPPAPATAVLPWLQPAANSTPEKPAAAPLGAVFKSACSQGCLQDEIACFNGCGGDHDCNVNCNNDYYCCLDTCNPTGPQCF